MLSLLTFNGNSQNVDVKGLLDKPETRTEIFNTILENHELMMEFMKNMKGNEHAMMMMEEDSKMMMQKMKEKGMMDKDDDKQEHKHQH